MDPTFCDHPRTKVLARDGNVDYVECLDCRKVFEAEDLEPPPATPVEEDTSPG